MVNISKTFLDEALIDAVVGVMVDNESYLSDGYGYYDNHYEQRLEDMAKQIIHLVLNVVELEVHQIKRTEHCFGFKPALTKEKDNEKEKTP